MTDERTSSDSGLETLVLRFGLFAMAIAAYASASRLWENGDVFGSWLSLALMLATWVLCFAMLVGSALREPPEGLRWLIPGTFAVAFVSFVHVDMTHEAISGLPGVTDLVVFMDYAGRLIAEGLNPYTHDLRAGYELYAAPLNFSTPLLDADYTGRLAYPALSPLIFTPFVMLGIPTEWVYPTFFALAMIALYVGTPRVLRPLVLLPFLTEQRYLLYAVGGVSDNVWAFLLLMVVITWHQRGWRAVWFGLACAFKHQPWLLAPFFLIRIWHETEGDWAARLRAMGLFTGLSIAAFGVVNAPFLVADPAAWWAGVMEPVATDMITLGQGISSFTMTGRVVLPKQFYTLFMLGGWALGLYAYHRHFHRLVEFMWIAPGIVLWLGNRSLTSYWYYYVIPMLLALLRTWWARREQPAGALPRRDWRLTVGLLGALVAFITASYGVYAFRQPPLEVYVPSRAYAGAGENVDHLFLTVRNGSGEAIEPRFAVQSWTDQPYFWTIRQGPRVLQPGERARYEIHSDVWYEQFGARRGALVTVSDADAYHLRDTVWLEPMTGHGHRGEIANSEYRYWRGDPLSPVAWGPVLPPEDEGYLRAAVGTPRIGDLEFVLSEPSDDEYETIRLDQYLDLPQDPLVIDVHVPADANRFPEPEVLYGVFVIADRGELLVLFGDEPRSGTLALGDEQVPYQVVTAPRGEWAEISLDLEALLEASGHEPFPVRHRRRGFVSVDYPMVPINLQLLLAAKDRHEPVKALFGPVRAAPSGESGRRRAFERSLAEPEGWSMWIGDYNYEARNYEKALGHYAAVLEARPDFEPALFQAAQAHRKLGQLDEAQRLYERLLAVDYEPGWVWLGLGEVFLEREQSEQAIDAFARAVAWLEAGWGVTDALKGIGVAHLQQGHCEEGGIAFDAAWRYAPGVVLPVELYQACIDARRE